jgi:hypothetical protein
MSARALPVYGKSAGHKIISMKLNGLTSVLPLMVLMENEASHFSQESTT